MPNRLPKLWIKRQFLEEILEGKKTVEVRVGYRNIQELKPGMRLLLNEKYEVRIRECALTKLILSIIIVHIMSMQRITVSLPKYLYENLFQQIPAGKISGFVVRAVEKELMKVDTDPIRKFIELRKKLPRKKKLEIIMAIEKGRV